MVFKVRPVLSKERAALALSAAIHLAAAGLVAASWPQAPEDKQRFGSQELDVELLAPRLAPPLRSQGSEGEEGRPGQRGDPGQLRARQGETPGAEIKGQDQQPTPARAAQAPEVASAPRAPDEAPEPPREERARADRDRPKQQPDSPKRAPAAAPEVVPARARTTAVHRRPVSRTPRSPATGAMPQELPTAAPLAVVAAVSNEISARQEQHRQALAAGRARQEAAEQELARLQALHGELQKRQTRSSRLAMTAGAGGARPVPGLSGGPRGAPRVSGGRGAGGERGQAGAAPRLGLRFYLSGRRVASGKVVRPPEPVRIPEVRCKIASPSVTPATVRMLVDMKGKVQVAYIKHSSSSKRFDRCALQHSRGITFAPGRAVSGTPLNVWIHLRVEPSLVTAMR